MVKRFKVTYPLPDGEEERFAYIYLPESYNKTKRKRYPVLYMFDGHKYSLMKMPPTANAGA